MSPLTVLVRLLTVLVHLLSVLVSLLTVLVSLLRLPEARFGLGEGSNGHPEEESIAAGRRIGGSVG